MEKKLTITRTPDWRIEDAHRLMRSLPQGADVNYARLLDPNDEYPFDDWSGMPNGKQWRKDLKEIQASKK